MKKSSLILFVALFTSFFSLQAQTPYKIDDQVNSISLTASDGSTVSTSDYSSADGFIIVFMTNECVYVKKYLDRIKALHSTYNSQGYQVLAINPSDPTENPGESASHMQEFLTAHNLSFPYLIDANREVVTKYNINSLPEAIILEKSGGNLYLRYRGAIDDDPEGTHIQVKPLEEALDLLIEGEEVVHSRFPAIGCAALH